MGNTDRSVQKVRESQGFPSKSPHKTQKNGGVGGIRTLEGLHPTRFPGVRLKPLGHDTIIFSVRAIDRTAGISEKITQTAICASIYFGFYTLWGMIMVFLPRKTQMFRWFLFR